VLVKSKNCSIISNEAVTIFIVEREIVESSYPKIRQLNHDSDTRNLSQRYVPFKPILANRAIDIVSYARQSGGIGMQIQRMTRQCECANLGAYSSL
jgi:hypothetical protein